MKAITNGRAPGGGAGGAGGIQTGRHENSTTKTSQKQSLPLPGTCLVAYLQRYRRELIPFRDDPHVDRLIEAVTLIVNEEARR